MSEWEVGEATAAERRELARKEIELFGPGGALDPQWLLDGNPAGRALVLVARAPGGRIAGTRSLLPWRVFVNGNEALVGQYTRTWTDPEFRRRGVSIAIGRELNRRSKDLGYPIVFLFPSDRSIPGHRHVGNRLETALERRQLLLSVRFFAPGMPAALDAPLGWMRRFRARGAKSGSEWSIAEDPPTMGAALWEQSTPSPGVASVRDAEFVRWRFSSASGRTYVAWRYPAAGAPRLIAFVHPAPGNRARLLDLWGVADSDERTTALVGLVEGLAARGAVLVEWCPPRHGSDPHVAERAGFFRRRRGVPMGLWTNRPPEDLGTLADPQSYRLTEGDSDYA